MNWIMNTVLDFWNERTGGDLCRPCRVAGKAIPLAALITLGWFSCVFGNQVFLKGMTGTAAGDLAFSSSATGKDGATYHLFNTDQTISFDGRFTVGPGPVLAKLAVDGTWTWAKGFGGALAGSVRMLSVAVNAEHILMGGLYTDASNRELSWDGTAISLTTESTNTMGLALKLDLSGAVSDAFASFNFGPAGLPSKCSSAFTAVALHSDGQMFLGGYYEPFKETSGATHGAGFYTYSGLGGLSGVGPARLDADNLHSVGGGYRRVPFMVKLNQSMDWEWARNYLAAPFGGFSTAASARESVNIANHGQVNKIALDPSGNAFFVGRVVGGESLTSYLYSSKIVATTNAADRQSIQVLVGNTTGDYRAANSFMLGRVKLDGAVTGFNFSFDAAAADHEAFLSDIILTPNGGYATGGARGDAVSFNQHVTGERPYLITGTGHLPSDELHQHPFVVRFDTSAPDLTINRVGIFLNNKTWGDAIQARGATLAAGPDGKIYLGLSMRGGVNSYTVGNPSASGPAPAQATDTILSPGSDTSYMHAAVRLRPDLSYDGELWKPETDVPLPFMWFPLRDTIGDYPLNQGTFLGPGFPSGAFEFQLQITGSRLLWAGTFGAYHTSSQRVIAAGNARTLAFANADPATRAEVSSPPSATMAAYITALDLTGGTPASTPFIEKTSLRIVTSLPAFVDGAGRALTNLITPSPSAVLEYIRGAEVKVIVPYQLYSDVFRTATGVRDVGKPNPRLYEQLPEAASQPTTFEAYRQNWPDYPRTRHTFSGFRIDEQSVAGAVPVFTLKLEKDTTLTVNFRQEHALDSVNLIAGETTTESILSDDQQRLLGNLTYSTSSGVDENLEVGVALPNTERRTFGWGRTWIPASERVQIDVGVRSSIVLPLGERFVATELKVRGHTETTTKVGEVEAFSPAAFTMTEPQEYEFLWKKQIQITLGPLAELEARDSVFVAHQLLAEGKAWLKPYTGGDAVYSPTRWFDYGAKLLVCAIDAPVKADNSGSTGLQLDGWVSAGGHFLRSQGTLPDLAASSGFSVLLAGDSLSPPIPGARVVGPYWATPPAHFLAISKLTQPTFVTWNYGGMVFKQFVGIGQYLGTNTIHSSTQDSKGTSYSLRSGNISGAPAISVVEGAPPGTSPANAMAWDAVRQRLYPLRPGRFLAQFPTLGANSQPSRPVQVEVTAGFPGDELKKRVQTAPDNESPYVFPPLGSEWAGAYKFAHYRHIAGAPGVLLDGDPTDGFFFRELSFFEASGTPASTSTLNPTSGTVEQGRFTSGLPGKGVLLFSRSRFGEGANGTINPSVLEDASSYPATGDLNKEPLFVRVVETRQATTNTPPWVTNSALSATRLGTLNGGGAYSVAISGNTAVLVGPTAPELRTVDLRDPANPKVLAALTDGLSGFNDLAGCFQVALAGSVALVAANADNALNLVDISNPSAPRLLGVIKDGVGGFNDLAGITSVTAAGTLTYVASAADHAVSIIDVSDPTGPVLRSVIKDGVGGFDRMAGAMEVVVENGTAYVTANQDNALNLIDVSDPSTPRLLKVITDNDPGFDRLTRPQGLRVKNGIAYINGAEGISILDVRNPAAPKNLGTGTDLREWVEVEGNLLFARLLSNNELAVVDIRKPSQLKVLGRIPFTGNQRPLVSGNRLYLPEGGGPVSFSIFALEVADGGPSLIAEEASAVIGAPLRSQFDSAELGTGWTLNDSPRLLINPRIYRRAAVQGPLIPVNRRLPGDTTPFADELTVVWYENPGRISGGREPSIAWPYQPVLYPSRNFQLPVGLERLYTSVTDSGSRLLPAGGKILHTSSRLGSDGLARSPGGNWVRQPELFNPDHQDVRIYHQPDRNAQGYNPNEEHALMAPAILQHGTNGNGGVLPSTIVPRSGSDQGFAVFALRDDLNYGLRRIARDTGAASIDPASFSSTAAQRESYTSEPFVLLEYFDTALSEHRMAVYVIGHESDIYKFRYNVTATQPIRAPYPLDTVTSLGVNDTNQFDNLDNPATPVANDGRISGTYYINGSTAAVGADQAVWWMDAMGNAWAISGPVQRKTSNGDLIAGSFTSPHLYAGFFYNLREDFWHPDVSKRAGDPVPWLPGLLNSHGTVLPASVSGPEGVPTPIRFDTRWPDNVPILKVGETLSFSGGEYKSDNPTTIRNGEVVETPGLPGVVGWAAGQILFDSANPAMRSNLVTSFTARLMNPLAELSVRLAQVEVTAQDNTFQPASADKISVRNGVWKFPKLSASLQKRILYDPILQKLVLLGYVSERKLGDPNLTSAPDPVYVLEPNILTVTEAQELAGLFAGSKWGSAVNTLYHLSRDPNGIFPDAGSLPTTEAAADVSSPYAAGLELKRPPNPAKNYPGSIYFDANNRTHSASFGPGLALVPNDDLLRLGASQFAEGYVTLVENAHPDNPQLGPLSLFVVKLDRTQRYRGAIKTVVSQNVFDEKLVIKHTGDFGANLGEVEYEWWFTPAAPGEVGTPNAPTPLANWQRLPGQSQNVVLLQGNPTLLLGDMQFFCRYKHRTEPDFSAVANTPFPWQWAGAGNSPQLQANGTLKYLPQLVMGWVKRVLDRVNPYEARFNDFSSQDSPATYSSLVQQAGAPPRGPVALNPDKNVIENVGLIELYQTILDRAIGLSIGLDQPAQSFSIWQALTLAATRLNQLYTILGNEAYSDAQDPTIGLATERLAPAVFAFQNQEASLLHEELSLLRGTDFSKGWPVENRLFWNFTKGDGEPAYAANYGIEDVNADGFIDESDAKILFPQGHGDAWGHYLSANKAHYALLRHPNFSWQTFAELYNLLDIVIETDFLDEVTFSRTAAAKARAGLEIVKSTYRLRYEQDANAQWQGYEDTDAARAWGVAEWGTRAYQGAYFDWVTANSLLPYLEHFRSVIRGGDGVTVAYPFDFPVAQTPHLRVFVDGQPTNNFSVSLTASGGTITFPAAPANGARIQIDNGNGIDTSANQLDKIDRVSLVELPELVSIIQQIQQTVDEANNGINPLGLAQDAVPFDLNIPQSRLTVGQTQFDQIYTRAINVAQNALATFKYANLLENRLRTVADATDSAREKAADQDRSYRASLIEIFGTPYDGLVGPGGLYPPGYQGPDLLLFQYVDYNSVNDFLPAPSESYKNLYTRDIYGTYETALTGAQQTILSTYGAVGAFQANGFALKDLIEGFTRLDVRAEDPSLPTFYDRFVEGSSFTIRSSLTGPYPVHVPTVNDPGGAPADGQVIAFNIPISPSTVYGFRAQPNWGKRRALGSIQTKTQELIGAQIDLRKALDDYEIYLRVLQAKIHNQQAGFVNSAIKLEQETAIRVAQRAVEVGFGVVDTINGYNEVAVKTIGELAHATREALPRSIGLSSDVTSVARAAILVGKIAANKPFDVSKFALDAIKKFSGYALTLEKDIFDLTQLARDLRADQRKFVLDLVKDLSDESTQRFNLASKLNSIVTKQYELDALVAKGFRTVSEREVLNKRLASDAQGRRYSDLLLRINRNTALQRYQGAFDLAVKYAYLAGKAYDYEANLDPAHPASPTRLLTDLIKVRTLGLWEGIRPAVGQGGLAEVLARMRANFDALAPSLGLNNPQGEVGRLSLRQEWARVKTNAASDINWRKVLQARRVEDLRRVPEFTRLCRPFAAADAGPQPGLVIPLSTEITAGRNFFGFPLGGMDHSYDPSQYATKIRGVSVWFSGYDAAGLALTPRVYLVPAGQDIMRVPDSMSLQTREWNVVDQKIPVPFPVTDQDLRNPNWLLSADSLAGSLAEIQRYSAFRAFSDAINTTDYRDELEVTRDSRLVGRSAWNSKWVLIIPGSTLHADPNLGLDRFVGSDTSPGVTDIKLLFETYANSGR